MAAVAAVLVYEAIGLLVPLTGGTVAYLMVRRKLTPLVGTAGEIASPRITAE